MTVHDPPDNENDPEEPADSFDTTDPEEPEPDRPVRPSRTYLDSTLLSDGTWTDDVEEGEGRTGPVVAAQDLHREQQRHVNSLQLILLKGLGGLIVFMVLVLVLGLALGGITEDFAKLLAQMTIPTLLTFGGAIVGTLFGKGPGGTAP